MELNITKFIKKETNLKDGNKSQKFTERELNVLIYKALNEQLILSGVVSGAKTCDCGSKETNFHKKIGCRECC